MKLFLKHLVRSIAKKPFQPIIIIFILVLSILSTTFTLTVYNLMTEEVNITQAEMYGNANITISLSGSSKSRFMFVHDVKKLLGDDVENIAGCYELPMVYGENKDTAFGIATDFLEIDEIFDFEFVEYGKITPGTISNSIFISKDFADKNGFSIDDEIMSDVLGETRIYKVVGISKTPFLGLYDVMVDITGIVEALAKESTIMSSLGDDFKPYSTIFINAEEDADLSDMIQLLQDDSKFSDKSIANVTNQIKTKSNPEFLLVPVRVSIFLVSIFAAVVIFSCLYIISTERVEENAIFSAAGAKPILLNTMQYIEMVIYWLVSALISLVLVLPSTKLFVKYAEFVYVRPSVMVSHFIFCTFAVLFVSIITVTAFILLQKVKNKNNFEKTMHRRISLVLLCITVLVTIFLFVVPASWKFDVFIVSIFSMIATIFVGSPLLMKAIVGKINTYLDKRFENNFVVKFPELKYALKNANVVKVLYNTARLIAVFSVVMVTFATILISSKGNDVITRTIFSSDYTIFNSTERCYQKVEECQSVDKICKVYMSDAVLGDNITMITALSTTDISVFSDENITHQPRGSEVVISSGIAKLMGVKEGDYVTISINNAIMDLKVAQIAKVGLPFVIFDAEHFDINYNMIMVTAKEGVSSASVVSEISEKTSTELATIASTDTLMGTKLRVIDVVTNAGEAILLIIGIYFIVGLINNLVDSYRLRKGEFRLYMLSGMSKSKVAKMKACEISIMFIFGAVIGTLGTVIALINTKEGLYNYGYELFINVMAYLGK